VSLRRRFFGLGSGGGSGRFSKLLILSFSSSWTVYVYCPAHRYRRSWNQSLRRPYRDGRHGVMSNCPLRKSTEKGPTESRPHEMPAYFAPGGPWLASDEADGGRLPDRWKDAAARRRSGRGRPSCMNRWIAAAIASLSAGESRCGGAGAAAGAAAGCTGRYCRGSPRNWSTRTHSLIGAAAPAGPPTWLPPGGRWCRSWP